MNFLTLIALAVCALAVSAKMQNATVKGVAICQKKRLAFARVQLWEKDTLGPNDLLHEVLTTTEGEFEVKGGEDEVGKIEPFLRIIHNCLVTKPECLRMSEYVVPQSKIDGVYDMTYVTLDIKVQGEKEKC